MTHSTSSSSAVVSWPSACKPPLRIGNHHSRLEKQAICKDTFRQAEILRTRGRRNQEHYARNTRRARSFLALALVLREQADFHKSETLYKRVLL